MSRDPAQDVGLGAGGHERENVAGDHSRVERFADSRGRQVELGQVGNHPVRPRVVLAGRGNQLWIRVDPDPVRPTELGIRSAKMGSFPDEPARDLVAH